MLHAVSSTPTPPTPASPHVFHYLEHQEHQHHQPSPSHSPASSPLLLLALIPHP